MGRGGRSATYLAGKKGLVGGLCGSSWEESEDGVGEVQKKRPFQSFSSSRGVKLRLLVR